MIQGSLRQPAGDAERYRTLLEINSALVSNLTREALFGAIAAALRRVVPFERSSCTTRNETCDGWSCWSPRCRRLLRRLVGDAAQRADVDEQRQRASRGERCCTRLARSTVNSGYSVD